MEPWSHGAMDGGSSRAHSHSHTLEYSHTVKFTGVCFQFSHTPSKATCYHTHTHIYFNKTLREGEWGCPNLCGVLRRGACLQAPHMSHFAWEFWVGNFATVGSRPKWDMQIARCLCATKVGSTHTRYPVVYIGWYCRGKRVFPLPTWYNLSWAVRGIV